MPQKNRPYKIANIEKKTYPNIKQDNNLILLLPFAKRFSSLTPAQKMIFLLAIVGAFTAPLAQVAAEPTSTSNNHLGRYSLFPKQNLLASYKNTNRDYYGIPVTDISHIKENCWKKNTGSVPGKICIINQQIYYMKKVSDQYHHALLGYYNLQFLKKNFGITVPDVKFFAVNTKNDKGLYLASAALTHFVSASNLQHGRVDFFSLKWLKTAKEFREDLTAKIGEKGIAQFMVAATFINDLHPENWGYDDQSGGLVIIDTDNSPRELIDFFTQEEHLRLRHYIIPLSINNVADMIKLYKDLLTKHVPTLHPIVDLSSDVYRSVLNIYIQACNEVLQHFSYATSSSRSGLWEINKMLDDKVKKLAPKMEVDPVRLEVINRMQFF